MKIQRKTSRADVPVMAMGDIAFNLLIFFVILAKVQDDSHLQWVPAQGEKIESAGQSRASVLIDKNHKLYLNGTEIGVKSLAGGLENLLGNAKSGQRVVLLKIHHDTPALRFQPVLEAIGESGGELVHILEKKK